MSQTEHADDAMARRGKTAMKRHRCSKAVALALTDGLIAADRTFFDYGCGHGADLRYLKSRKIVAAGWDPAHRPKAERKAADVVNLGYVLNVIESPSERRETLLRAFELTQRILIVSVRVDNSLTDAETEGDGLVTSRGTFQRIFTQAELRAYLKEVLGHAPYMASLGIAYIFKDPELEAAYVATRTFTRRLEYRTDLVEQFAGHSVAKRFVKLTNRLGRIPLPEEFKDYSKLLEAFGSSQRIRRLTLRQVNPEAWEGTRGQRQEDILTYLATLRLSGLKPPRLNSLPPSIRGDIKALWPSYSEAQKDGEAFLFQLGDPSKIRAACKEAPYGKRLPGDFYIHSSGEDDLPALLRVLVFAAKQIVGDMPYDVLKIKENGRAVSFLMYGDFDAVAHPALRATVRVYLPKADYQIRDYGESENPPILHRKDSMVAKDYPHYERFRALTETEEEAGLLGGSRIGYQQLWEGLLTERGHGIRGHELVDLCNQLNADLCAFPYDSADGN